jgi:peptidoglycan DL-endopeptidase CwlO
VGLRALPSVLVPVVVASWLVLPAAAGADPVSNSRSQLNQVNNQLQGAQAQAAAIESQLQADGERLDILSQQYETDEQQVQELTDQLATVKAQVAATEAKMAATEAQLREDALQSYESGATDDSFDNLFEYGGQAAVVSEEYARVAGVNLTEVVDTLHQEQLQLSAEQSQLQTTEDQAQAVANQAQTAEEQAQAVTAQQQAALRQVKGQVASLLAAQQRAQQAVAAALYQQQLQEEEAAAQTTTHVAVSPGAAGAVQAAESQLGVPYRWGAESPKGSVDPGFDCSGLTQWSWAQAGVYLPRTAQEQYDAIPHVGMSDLQPGDLVFWDDGTSSVQHVGMYVGSGDVIDAPETGENVQIQPIWSNGLVGAGRP